MKQINLFMYHYNIRLIRLFYFFMRCTIVVFFNDFLTGADARPRFYKSSLRNYTLCSKLKSEGDAREAEAIR